MSATLRQQCQTSLGAGLRWQNYTFYFICAKKIVFHRIVINAHTLQFIIIIKTLSSHSRRWADGQRFWDRPPPLAFDNKVALTDDRVIVWATYVSAFPKANRRSLGLLWGPRFFRKQINLGLLWGPNANHEQAPISSLFVEFKIQNSKFKILNYLPLRICIFCRTFVS